MLVCGGIWVKFGNDKTHLVSITTEFDPSLYLFLPKQIREIKDFLVTVRRKDAKEVRIKKNGKITKFKVRCGRFLYTLRVTEQEKVQKLVNILPAIKVVYVDAKK
ncbi:hypothetical protein SAMD00019534_029790 [Acytostelium subglobosum LB1]|uniref:hypothetical protein n=1 Tax=Acytostelium subglobosum LB1 TaxID=1410327 RepID=UPI000644FBED|nr:hypothetical protein SAMD00019534_029790 [Acytostelium subglobosum LB1]GAM19804.1 hypothetical protein SAMD00019534_029790 [Acytostelium subglobosum LB1]|eukprot:XP_012756566.1 hypothetical protein SAMD00019534_029790 [Acytostelium subglobosum LB1]